MSDDDDCIIIEDNLNYNYKSISCENIPELFLDKLTAKKHFSRFGKIKRYILRPMRRQCTVEYEKEEDAENAFVNAAIYNGQQFDIKYTENEVAHTRNTEEWVDPDVQAELDAMGNTVRGQSRGASVMRHLPPRMPKPILKTPKPVEGITRLDGSAKSELEAILRKPAADAEDRYRILDARDKLIRLSTIRTTDIRKAVSIKGICPDMCPEKERLLREAKHQVSLFELENGSRNVMDHRIAIKEYSRSSADQETPLTHELRPEPVLQMTMTYLMHEIMDLCDDPGVNIGDWYHFVWDRTRSIRKDITQQELCSLAAVQLVEQCARFHIHCAARLIAEDASVFDQKINTENLTKCLQTLKYMYHDLRLKNVKCPNEAEFRAYVVLLNLSDSNFLWEVKQLPEEIQNSPEVQFALAVYLAVESSNYVKFFGLVRKTTYLNACILLRYFTQVRVKAIKIIMKAYNWPRHLVALPLKYLKEILAFESEEAAISLFNYYGLDCDSEKVFLDRNAFYVPDIPFFMERSLAVVEAKRVVSVGEIVCGQNLDSVEIFKNHVPHNSFDEEGYLRPEAWTAEDQIPGTPKKTIPKDPESSLFKVPKASPPISPKLQNKSIFQLRAIQENGKTSQVSVKPVQPAPPVFSLKPPVGFGSLAQSNTNGMFGSLFPKPHDEGPVADSKSESNIFAIPAFGKPSEGASVGQSSIFGGFVKPTPITGSLFGPNSLKSDPNLQTNTFKTDNVFKHFDVTPQSFPGESKNLLLVPKKAEVVLDKPTDSEKERWEQEKIEKGELKEKLKKEKEEKKKIAELEKEKKRQEKEKQKEQEKIRKEKIKEINKKSQAILKEILTDTQKEEIREISTDELAKYTAIISKAKDMADELIEECVLEYLGEIVEDETSILTKNQKILQKYFQIWRHNVLLKKERRKLIESTPIWMMQEPLETQAANLAHLYQDETLQMMTRYRLGVPANFDLRNPDHDPIDIISLILPEFRGKVESNDRGILKSRKYLKIILSIPLETEEVEGFNLYFNRWLEENIARNDKHDSKVFLCESRENLTLCIRKISGIISRNEENVKVTTECDNADALLFIMSCGNLLDSRRRLHHLLKLSQIYKEIPLAIVMYNSTLGEEFIKSELELEKLIDDGKISSYIILGSYDRIRDDGLRTIFEKGLKFLAHSFDDNYDLETQQLSFFISSTLGNELWGRLHESWVINPSFRKFCTQPGRAVELYNHAIDKLITLLDEDFSQSPEFPAELREFVPELQYDIPLDLEYFPKDWKIDERNFRIKRFLKKVKLKPFKEVPPDIGKLENALLQYSTLCLPIDQSLANKSGYSAIKFLLEKLNSPDLFDLSIKDKMNFISWLGVLKPIALALLSFVWGTEYKYLPKEVIYRKSLLNDYITTPWWLDNKTVKTVKMVPSMDEEDESFLRPPDAKKLKTDPKDEKINLDEILAKGFSLIDKADRNIETFKRLSTVGREVTRSFDENLYKQEMAVRSMKRFIRENV